MCGVCMCLFVIACVCVCAYHGVVSPLSQAVVHGDLLSLSDVSDGDDHQTHLAATVHLSDTAVRGGGYTDPPAPPLATPAPPPSPFSYEPPGEEERNKKPSTQCTHTQADTHKMRACTLLKVIPDHPNPEHSHLYTQP